MNIHEKISSARHLRARKLLSEFSAWTADRAKDNYDTEDTIKKLQEKTKFFADEVNLAGEQAQATHIPGLEEPTKE